MLIQRHVDKVVGMLNTVFCLISMNKQEQATFMSDTFMSRKAVTLGTYSFVETSRQFDAFSVSISCSRGSRKIYLHSKVRLRLW